LDDIATAPVAGDAIPARRRRLRFGRSMMPVFAGLSAALLALALVIGQTIVAQRDARERAMNEGDTLLGLNEVMSAMLNGETGQRGYLLTGKPEYLAPYLDAKQRRDRAFTRLREMSGRSPDPDLPRQLDRLDGMTNAKFAELDRSVALAQAGFRDQALALVQADLGKLQMDAIRREAGELGAAAAIRRLNAFERAATLEQRLLPLVGVLGVAIFALVYAGFRAERSRSLAEAEAEQAAALREANERTELLARELTHRVKNLFSVILSIVTLSGRKQASSGEILGDIRDRIRALSLAHSASLGSQGTARASLGPVVVTTMEPYADDGGTRVRVSGPDVELPVRMVTPLGLIIHELATNAVKYGALSVESGTVDIRWEIDGGDPAVPSLILDWIETGGPAIAPETADHAKGFGSQMTTLAARQLGGVIEREWPISGAIARLKFPLA
jgi:two-component sensor histidine kinase/CHASE3 domain sensor protein